MVEDMEEIRIKVRSERYKFDAVKVVASHIVYPDWWDFRNEDGVKYTIRLISDEDGIKTFAVQTEIDAIIHGWEDFEKPSKKWYQFWKR